MSTFPPTRKESLTAMTSTKVMETSNETVVSNYYINNKNVIDTKMTTIFQKTIVNGSCHFGLDYSPTMSILPYQRNQSMVEVLTDFVTIGSETDLTKKPIIRKVTHFEKEQDRYVKDDDLTTSVNAALMGYNVTRRRSMAGVPDLFIYYHSPQLLFLITNEKLNQQQLWILLYEMNIDPSLDLQQVFINFFRRFLSPTSDNHQNTIISTNKVLRTTNTCVDNISTKEMSIEHPVNKDHQRQYTITPTRRNSILIPATRPEGALISNNNESPPAGFIYAPTTAAGGSPIKAHDTITNHVHLPHEISSVSLSLPSSRKNTTDNFNNSRRGSKDSSNSLSASGLTVDTIIDRLIRPEVIHNGDDQIIPIFIIFFRKFMNPHELASTLIKRFEDDLWIPTLPTLQQQRIVYILTTWMTDYWGDFYHHQTREQLDLFIGRLSEFMISTGSSSMQKIIEKLHPILMRSAPIDDPDDIWGKKYNDDDIQDFSNYNKKKDSGYISSYSGISPDSPTDDGFRLDDMIWSRHLHTPSPSPPPLQNCMGSKSVACSIKHQGITKLNLGALHTPDTRIIPSSKTNKMDHLLPTNNVRQIHQVTISRSPSSSPSRTHLTSTSNKTCPKFAGGLIFLDTGKSRQYPNRNLQRNTKACLPLSSSPSTHTFYSTGCLPTPSPSTLNISNSAERNTRVAHNPIRSTTHQILSTTKTHYSSDSVKFNTTLLLTLTNQEIAEQLTWIEAELFGKIKSREFVRVIWGSHDNNNNSNQPQKHTSSTSATKSGLMASISHFNFVSAWVISMIVTQPKLGKRVALLERFMMIAVALRDLNNYNTLMAILAGISNAAILRLKQTQEGIKKKQKIYKRYLSLEKLMSSDRSHCSYRMALKASSGYPCIPYLGIHSQDLIALAEANKDVKTDGTIHWEKFRFMGECIMAIINKQHQQPGYDIIPNTMVLTWIAQIQILTDEEQYQQSIQIEPRLKSTSMTRIRDRCLRI